jgi:hypothetical protein
LRVLRLGGGKDAREGQKQGQGSCHRLVFVDPEKQYFQWQGLVPPCSERL